MLRVVFKVNNNCHNILRFRFPELKNFLEQYQTRLAVRGFALRT